jgi:hypothetical protein
VVNITSHIGSTGAIGSISSGPAMRAARRKLLNILLGLVLLLAIYKVTLTSRGAPKRPLLYNTKRPSPLPEPGRASYESTNGAFHKGPYFHYPVSSFIALPTASTIAIPKIQHKFEPEDATARAVREKRLAAVKEALGHSWKGYEEHAWLFDEVAPISGGYRTTIGGWRVSMVDSLDTLWIMGMQAEFEEAVFAAATINFSTTEHLPLNVFETTIRYLGGFLGAYDVSNGKYPVLLEKAKEVGEVIVAPLLCQGRDTHDDRCSMMRLIHPTECQSPVGKRRVSRWLLETLLLQSSDPCLSNSHGCLSSPASLNSSMPFNVSPTGSISNRTLLDCPACGL